MIFTVLSETFCQISEIQASHGAQDRNAAIYLSHSHPSSQPVNPLPGANWAPSCGIPTLPHSVPPVQSDFPLLEGGSS